MERNFICSVPKYFESSMRGIIRMKGAVEVYYQLLPVRCNKLLPLLEEFNMLV